MKLGSGVPSVPALHCFMAFSDHGFDHPKVDPALVVFALAVLFMTGLLAFTFGWH